MVAVLLSLIVVSASSTFEPAPNDSCPDCRADRGSIKSEVERLRSAAKWRSRAEAAEALGSIRRQCHPEVVDALSEALRGDKKAKVRAEAAASLGRMAPNLPSSHVALQEASKSDPVTSVRKEATRALAAKGLRCVVDCPICGPLPKGGGITGPSVGLPEWDSKTDRPKPASPLPQALPEAIS